MQRKQIHQQIETIVGKLYQLNKYLLTSEDMLEIEVDLIKTYMTELNRLTALLNAENAVTTTAQPEATSTVQPEIVPNIKEPVAEIIIREPVKAEEIILQPTAASEIETPVITEEPKQPEPEPTIEEDEDVKFIKEEIVEPILHEVEKEMKAVETHVKEAVEQIKADIGNKSLNELFSGSKMELADKLFHHTTGKPLKDFISIGDKFMFISELFNKDLMAYENAIKKLNDIHSLDEAQQYIEQELNSKFDWSKKQDAVKHFKSILKKKFGVAEKN